MLKRQKALLLTCDHTGRTAHAPNPKCASDARAVEKRAQLPHRAVLELFRGRVSIVMHGPVPCARGVR
ncbi:hypothetical protein SAMN05421875_13436 [Acidovorax soli]|jgi:hypothetical protein|uniref:Uncharacterized protein n=1 Tax=Acidovorax soli TaxID=592050 RepID=A0A1H4EFE2_9BURK|nr:hypothetical protein SAMN05421875_13436 [Acidovorax soli]